MLMMFALLYLNGLRSDWLYLNTCWEGSAPLHVFGPNWSVDLLMKALKGLPLAMIILGASAWVTHKTVQTRGNQVPE